MPSMTCNHAPTVNSASLRVDRLIASFRITAASEELLGANYAYTLFLLARHVVSPPLSLLHERLIEVNL